MEKNLPSIRSTLFFLPFLFTSCYSIRNVFNERPEIAYFEGAGNGNINGGIAIKENILSANLSATYSPIDQLIMGATVHTYSNTMFDDSQSGYLHINGKEALFSGKKISAFLGYYKNFGVNRNKYTEFRSLSIYF